MFQSPSPVYFKKLFCAISDLFSKSDLTLLLQIELFLMLMIQLYFSISTFHSEQNFDLKLTFTPKGNIVQVRNTK